MIVTGPFQSKMTENDKHQKLAKMNHTWKFVVHAQNKSGASHVFLNVSGKYHNCDLYKTGLKLGK